jgi:hypothetical protein
MESEGSLSCSQGLATGPYPESDESGPHLPNFFHQIHFNIIIQYTPGYSEWSLPLGLSTTTLYAFLIVLMRATFPAHPSSLILSS